MLMETNKQPTTTSSLPHHSVELCSRGHGHHSKAYSESGHTHTNMSKRFRLITTSTNPNSPHININVNNRNRSELAKSTRYIRAQTLSSNSQPTRMFVTSDGGGVEITIVCIPCALPPQWKCPRDELADAAESIIQLS